MSACHASKIKIFNEVFDLLFCNSVWSDTKKSSSLLLDHDLRVLNFVF